MPDKRKYADRKEALIRAVSKRRKKIKALAIEYKGGKCQICGYSHYQGALGLHHRNPKEKSFGIGDKGYTRAWEIVRHELDKCILLCANCHREVAAGIEQLPGENLVVQEVNSVESVHQRTIPSQAEIKISEGVETIPMGVLKT